MEYVGIDRSYRRAAWCALSQAGQVVGEGAVAAHEVNARVLADLCRPELWVLSLSDRELRERLRQRTHLVRRRASAMNRIFGLLTQCGLRCRCTGCGNPMRWTYSNGAACPGPGAPRSQKR